jgi:nicotinate-nucleotide adenylyltransferase
MKKRIAFFGGSFDPVHNAHVRIARKLPRLFKLDEFFFVPAFHAPHKPDLEPVSAYHRFAMLNLVTENEPEIKVSTIELDMPEKPFTVETAARIKDEMGDAARMFFVIGADSWRDIATWREWEKLLLMADFIVVDRPGTEMDLSHVTPQIRERTVNLRGQPEAEITAQALQNNEERIYFTDAVQLDISATKIREQISRGEQEWREKVPPAAAQYIEKYRLYQDHGTNFERKITSA